EVHEKCKDLAYKQTCSDTLNVHDVVPFRVETPMSCCGRCNVLMKAGYNGYQCSVCGIVCHISCSKSLPEVCSVRYPQGPKGPQRKEMSYLDFMTDPKPAQPNIGSGVDASELPEEPIDNPLVPVAGGKTPDFTFYNSQEVLVPLPEKTQTVTPRGLPPKSSRPHGAVAYNQSDMDSESILNENDQESIISGLNDLGGERDSFISHGDFTRSPTSTTHIEDADGDAVMRRSTSQTFEAPPIARPPKRRNIAKVKKVIVKRLSPSTPPSSPHDAPPLRNIQIKESPLKTLDTKEEGEDTSPPPPPRKPRRSPLKALDTKVQEENTSPPPPPRKPRRTVADPNVASLENGFEHMEIAEVYTTKSTRHSNYSSLESSRTPSPASARYSWDTNLSPIVLDNGSGRVKAGFADEELPSCIFPAVVGRIKHRRHLQSDLIANTKDVYVGNHAQAKRGILSLSYPIEHGVITSWEDIELIWEATFNDELRVDPSERPVLLTEAPYNPVANKHTMAQIMFETFQVPATFIAIQAVLSMYSTGKLTGIVLDSGDGVTHACPMYKGYLLPHSVLRMNLAGRDLTEYMMDLLTERGYFFTTTAEREIVRDIKEKCCYVAYNFDDELVADKESGSVEEYTLPDGQVIGIGSECFRCPEALFQPSLLGLEMQGMHGLVNSSIFRSDVSIRAELFGNIVLSGGTTTILGLADRLHMEVSALAPNRGMVSVGTPPNQEFSVWQGGAALASLSSFTEQWITREEYDEYGDTIVDIKSSLMR
ncbi:hypothetical protein SARC_10181, partial [Sphaeroforma arctica JP610]